VLNGEGGTGATINLISRAPSFDKQPFELDYAFSSYNSHRLHAGTGGAIKEDAVAYRADISTNRFGSNVHGERTELDRFTGSLLFKLSNTLKLTLELDRLHDDVEDLYYGTPLVNGRISKSLRRINYNNLTDNKYKSDTTWLRANLEWQVAPDVEVRNQAYYYDSFRDWRDVDDFTYIAGATPKVRRNTWADLDHDHQLVGNRLDALFKGTLAGMDNRFVVGTDINRTNFKTKRNGFPAGTEAPVDAYNPPSVSLSSGTSVFKTLARDVTIEQWSIFAEDQLSLTSKLKLVGGFRHDNFKTNWTYFDQAGAPKESKAHTFNSWRAGVVYDLMPSDGAVDTPQTLALPRPPLARHRAGGGDGGVVHLRHGDACTWATPSSPPTNGWPRCRRWRRPAAACRWRRRWPRRRHHARVAAGAARGPARGRRRTPGD
jgi:iron complex outermembrane receptor protein